MRGSSYWDEGFLISYGMRVASYGMRVGSYGMRVAS